MAILLDDDLSGNSLTGWTQEDDAAATSNDPGVWAALSGRIEQTSNIFGPNDGDYPAGTNLTYDAGFGFARYKYTVDVRSTDNDDIGVLAYYQDIDNYYLFTMNSQVSEIYLIKKVAGVVTTLAEDLAVGYTTNQTYEIEIDLQTPGQITVSRDSVELFGGAVADSDLTSGTIGFWSSANANSEFDNVLVENLASGTPQVGFTVDPDAVSVYQFEDGFLPDDSIGTNDFTASGTPVVDLVNFQEGAGAVSFDGSSYYTLSDAAQSANYPLKNGQSNETYTVFSWVRLESTTGPLNLWGKADSVNRSQLFRILSGTNTLSYSVHTGVIFEDNDFEITLDPDVWYHLALEVEHNMNTYRLTVYNSDTTVEETVSLVGAVNVSTPAAPWSVGADGAGQNPVTGEFDEYALINRVVGLPTVRDVRNGTYLGPLAVRMSSMAVQTLFITPETDVLVSNMAVQVLATNPGGPARVSTFAIQALYKPAPAAVRSFPATPTQRVLQSQTGKRVFPL